MNEISKYEEPVGSAIDQSEDATLSRRSFVSSLGALIALPTVAGGFLMPAWTDQAYAADGSQTGGLDGGSPETKLIVAKKNEFGIVVCDMVDNKKVPVPNANVKITSLSNKKDVSGKTDSEGKVLLDISSLAKLTKDENGVEMYSFYAQLEVSCQGYRTYHTGRVATTGGRGIMAPTRKLNGEKVYPRLATFDDWDILYTANAFAVTSGNDVKHTFKIELVADTPGPVKIRLRGKQTNTVEIASATVTPKNGIAKAEFSDYYLLSIHKAALPIGSPIDLVIEYEMQQHTVTLAMKTQKSPDKTTAPGTAKLALKPFDPNGLKPSITMPKWVPVVGGQVVNVWTPELPASIWFDPFGFVKFVARTGELGYKYKEENGKVSTDAWKYHPRKTSEEQWAEADNERKALISKCGKAIRGKSGVGQSVHYTSKIGATAMLQIAMAGKWRDDEALWRAGISAQAVLAFNVSHAQQFMVGPVPCIFDFSFVTSLTIGVSAALASTDLSDISKYTWDYGNAGISFTLVIAPSISLGIGIKGLLSASIQGQLSFSFCVAIQATPHDAGKELPKPHITMGLVAQVNVVIQAFIFSKSIEIWKVGDPTWYDNWHGKVPGNESKTMSTQEEVDYFGDGMQLVKDEWLLDVGEFDSDGFAEEKLSTHSVGAPAVQLVEKEGQTSDGITYHYTMFEPADSTGETRSISVDGKGLAAGSSPALTAQGLQAQDDESAKLPSEGKYNASDPNKYKAFVEERSSKRFKGVASQSGLVPANDVCVAKGVFSDPRIKSARIGDKTYVFRIATTKVDGQARTRIVGQVLGSNGNPSGDMKVFDFGLERNIFTFATLPNRNDWYDYDFDVMYTAESSPRFGGIDLMNLLVKKVLGTLTFFVVSGKRAAGDKTGFGQAACDQMFSIVTYYMFEDGENRLVSANASVTSDPSFDAAGGGNDYKYHSFSCPQIARVNTAGTDGLAGWMLTYLDRAGKTPEDAVSADEGKAKVGLGVCFMDITGKISAVKTHELVQKVQPITDSSIYEMTCSSRLAEGSDKASGWYLIMLRGRKEALYYLLRAASGANTLFIDKSPIAEIQAIKVQGTDTSEPMRLVEWPGHTGTFLTSKAGKLQKVTIDNLGKGTPSLTFKDCGLSNFNVNSFGLDPTGSVIFWPSCSEDNAGYKYDKDGKGEQRKWTEVHQIMGSRLRNDIFSEAFVYGEVKHDMHVMQVLDYLNSSTLTVLSVDMTDALKGKADLWFTSIPLVKCANVIGCEAASSFAYPGEKALFYLTVRNDGNTFLSGFTAKLGERGKDPVSSAKLVFSKGTLCESGYNPQDGGSLKDVEPDYALAPGKTSVYQVEIEIPKDWSNEKNVSVLAADAVMASAGNVKTHALGTQAELEVQADSVEEYIIGTGDDGKYDYDEELDPGTGEIPYDTLSVWQSDTYDDDYEEDYQDAPIVPPEAYDGKEDDKRSSSSSSSGSKESSSSSSSGSKESSSSSSSGSKESSSSSSSGSKASSSSSSSGSNASSSSSSGGGNANSSSSSGGSKTSASSTVAKTSTRSTSPSTNDPMGPLGLVAAAVTAAGIGMVAYSKRRSALEGEDFEDD